MEETKESRNDNKKIVIKMGGGGGGGGIGAVVLLGGALATAAFASAFVLGKKRRSSDKDRGRNSSPEIDEKEEAKEGQDEQEHTSKVEKKEVDEVEKDSTIMNSDHSLKMEKVGEVEATKVEDDPISVDGFVIVKEGIPSLSEEKKQENVQSLKEQVSDDQVSNERERESDGGSEVCDDGEDTEAVRADINGVRFDETNFHEDVSMEEKKEIGECCNGDGEIIEEKFLEPEATETGMVVDLSGEEDFVEIVEATVKSEEDQVDINGCILPLSPESILTVVEEDETSMQFDGDKNEGELISTDEVEVVKYVANEEVPQNLKLRGNEADSQPEENEDDVETESEREVEEEVVVDGNGNATMTNMMNGEVSRKDGDEESNEVVEKKSLVHTSAATNSVKTMDLNEKGEENSKWEAQWQGEWPKAPTKEPKKTKRMSYEVGGKMQEDYSAKDEVIVVKDHPSNSTRWRMMIWTLSVLTSLSCSWYLDLSPAKLCLAVFLTVFMLEMYGYPLLNRKRLPAAEGERIYEQRSSKK